MQAIFIKRKKQVLCKQVFEITQKTNNMYNFKL